MKAISYSIFFPENLTEKNKFEFMAYLRGLYFNARMNKLLYPNWVTHITVDDLLLKEFGFYFNSLTLFFGVKINAIKSAPLCESMLWRMLPVFSGEYTHVLCRDADSITTYKEAQAVNEWLQSGLGFHGITDNPAHTQPMMGGMVGFDVEQFKKTLPQFTSFQEMIKDQNLSERGSDQVFMRNHIYPNVRHKMFCHYFSGLKHSDEAICKYDVSMPVPNVSPRFWESNLTCRHIGSAGVVEMELLRFFQRHDPQQYDDFEQEFKQICYWKQ